MKFYLLLAFCSIAIAASAQTNTFPASGSVGIGTTSPRAYLDVATASLNTLTTVLGRLPEGDSDSSGSYLGVHTYVTQPGPCNSFSLEHKFYGRLNSSINFYRGGSYTGGFITFTTNNGTERMRLDDNGNLGIGTTNTGSYKLAVEGVIGARKIKITQASWADFVFDEDYELPSLTETAGYIKMYKHLPGVPDEAEVKREGVDIGEMNKVLLQKVEELTLYLIEMKRELEEQRKVVEEQRTRIEGLERK